MAGRERERERERERDKHRGVESINVFGVQVPKASLANAVWSLIKSY